MSLAIVNAEPHTDEQGRTYPMPKCYSCQHRRRVVNSAHSACAKPDSRMKGHPHGERNGWFDYPDEFDPIWCASECRNYERKGGQDATS